jgi:hypothetical protein
MGLCIEYISQQRQFYDFITGDLETNQKSITYLVNELRATKYNGQWLNVQSA